MPLARFTALLFSLYLTLGQRYTIGTATGGRGTVSPLEILFIAFAALLWFRMAWRPLRPVARGIWLPTIGPLFSLLLALPIVGVLTGGYELRTLYSYVVVLIPVSILVLGQAMRRYGVHMRATAFAAILAHGLYGFGQLLYRLGVMPDALWGWAARWDAQSQTAFSDNYLISSRSTGLFLNANDFGMWSVFAVIFGAVYLRRSPRILSVLFGVIGVIGSQSRTAWVALALLAVGYLLTVVVVPRVAEGAIVTILMASPLVAILALFGVFHRMVEADSVTRLLSGLQVLTKGAQADPNLAGRYDSWARANALAAEYTFGTFGPPQVKLGGSIDNQFVSFYLQGGVILVLAYALALLAPLVLWNRGVPRARTLAVMTGTLAIFSFTASPVDSPMGSAMVWVAAAISFAALGETDRFRPDPLAPNGTRSRADLRGDHHRESRSARMVQANLQLKVVAE